MIWTGVPSAGEVPVLIWSGLVNGATGGGLGIALVLGLRATGVLNLAVGSIAMISALAFAGLTRAGTPVLAAALVVLAMGGAIGAVEEVGLLRPLRGKPAASQLFATIGLSLILQGVAIITAGREAIAAPAIVSGSHRFGRTLVSWPQIALLGAASAFGAGVHRWLRSTRRGLQTTAVGEDEGAAALIGIDVDRIRLGSFVAVGMACAVMGLLAAPISVIDFISGLQLSIAAFVAAIVGGGRSALGALVGGLVVGLVNSFGTRMLSNAIAGGLTASVLIILVLAAPRILARGQLAR